MVDRNPSDHDIHISKAKDKFDPVMYLQGGGWINLRGLDFRYYAIGLRIETGQVHVADCSFGHMRKSGIFSSGGSSNSVFENNEFFDTSLYDWPWYAMKNYEMPTSNESNGIQIRTTSARGNVIRNNTFDGMADAVAVASSDTDIHNNTIRHIA